MIERSLGKAHAVLRARTAARIEDMQFIRESNPGIKDWQVAARMGVGRSTVTKWRLRVSAKAV
jgi:DNA-binding transcriptional regulator YiaG